MEEITRKLPLLSFNIGVQSRKPVLNAPRPALGIDTETFNGRARLITDSTGNHVYPENWDQVAQFLLSTSPARYHRFLWNLSFDVGSWLRHLDEDTVWLLYRHRYEGRIPGTRYFVRFIDGKVFYLREEKPYKSHKSRAVWLWDLSQFFGRKKLEEVARKHLKTGKLIDIDPNRLNKDENYWKGQSQRHKILRYCIRDATITQNLAEKVYIPQISKIIGFTPRVWYSPANVAALFARSRCYLPTLEGIPEKVIVASTLSFHGGHIECYQRGTFEKVWNYDINSAYPSIIRDIPDLSAGTWNQVDEYTDNEYGFYLVQWTQEKNLHPVFPVRASSGSSFYVNGRMFDILTAEEVRAIRDKRIPHTKLMIFTGWVFEPDGNFQFPYRAHIDDLFEKRKTDPEHIQWYKDMATMLYGKLIDCRHGRCGDLFNPMVAATATAHIRLKMFDALRETGNHAIMVMTDGLYSEKPLRLDIGDGIGQWTETEYRNPLFVEAGVYHLVEDPPRLKGIGKALQGKTLPEVFSLIPDDATEINFVIDSPVKLTAGIVQHRFNQVGTWQPRKFTLFLHDNLRRDFSPPAPGPDPYLDTTWRSEPLRWEEMKDINSHYYTGEDPAGIREVGDYLYA